MPYVHVDISDEFSRFGKYSVLVLCAVFAICLRIPHCTQNVKINAATALFGGISMVLLRQALEWFDEGPHFDVRGNFVLEPIISLLGHMITIGCMAQQPSGGFLKLPMTSRTPSLMLKLLIQSMILTMVFTDLVVVPVLLTEIHATDVSSVFFVLSGATLGSVLSITGSFHGLALREFAYDDISWIEFAQNTILPTMAALSVFVGFGILSLLLLLQSCTTNTPTSTTTSSTSFSYSGLSSVETQANTEQAMADDNDGKGHTLSLMESDSVEEGISNTITLDSPSEEKDGSDEEAAVAVNTHDSTPPTEEASYSCRLLLFAVAMLFASFATQNEGLSILCGLFSLAAFSGAVFSSRSTQVTVVTAILLYGFNFHPTLVSATLACAWLYYTRCCDSNTPGATQMPQIDMSQLLVLAGTLIMIPSLADTGLSQSAMYFVIDRCAAGMTGPECVLQFATVVATSSIVFSRVTTVALLASTFPYASPYDWIVVGFAITIAGNIASALHFLSTGRQASNDDNDKFPMMSILKWSLVPTVLGLLCGIEILTNIHSAPECSRKLGECDFGGF